MSPDLMNSQLLSARTEWTTSSWASVIENYTAVPAPFKSACQPLLGNIQPFPYVVFAPVMSGFRQKIAEQLICEVNDTITIWEHMGDQIITAAYPLKDISMVEEGHILLYSWLTINGVTSQGVAASATVSFNTVTAPYFEPFVDRVRPASADVDQARWQAEKAKFDYLETASFKFMNFARRSLVPGEQVIRTFWQPKIRKPFITLFGWSLYRTLYVAHLAVLTDKEVIFIGDDARLTETRGGQHGGIWQYVPLEHIVSASLTKQNDLLTLSLTLSSDGHHLNKLFAAANQREIEQFRDALALLIGVV